MKKTKKRNFILLLTGGIILLTAIILSIVYFVSTNKDYTHAEKKWISDNSNNVVDIYVQSNLPVFSTNGSGVFYDYLTALENDTGISFNIIYTNTADYSMTLKSDEKNSITFYKDHYVVISKNKINIESLKTLENMKVGILIQDESAVKQYLSDYKINYKGYGTFDDLKVGFSSGASEVAIVPLYLAMNDIISESYVINYHVDGFNAYYSLNLSDNTNLNGIMQKFYDRWSEKSDEKRNEHLKNLYYKNKGFTELEKSQIINDDYTVGYINMLPFEGIVNNTFTGLTSAYLSGFSDLSGATYKYRSYKSLDALINALNTGEIDIAANYYGITLNNYENSNTFSTNDYVVLTHADNTLVIETLSTLAGSNIEMLSNMGLTNSLKLKSSFAIKEYSTAKEMFRKINKDSIVLVDKYFYEYYKTKQLKNYVVKYTGTFEVSNSFLLKSSNVPFNKIFNFYMSLNSDNEMGSISTQKLYSDARNNVLLSFILNNIFYIILILGAGGFISYKLAHKIRLSKRIKKEDKLLYIDVMTNLKNRNYLNDNIDYWSENKVYPQTILIVDLNRIKDLNDRLGHEEGDKQIKVTANALIRTQRENSEIMRTNGNEFMVYLVGYEEKMILSYIHKLTREINNNLPHKEYGVALGYSMIKNDLSTIDDAINDATKIMRKNKGESSESKN